MTLELLHGIRDYTLTRTSIPNHAGNIKDMKYALIAGIRIHPRPFRLQLIIAGIRIHPRPFRLQLIIAGIRIHPRPFRLQLITTGIRIHPRPFRLQLITAGNNSTLFNNHTSMMTRVHVDIYQNVYFSIFISAEKHRYFFHLQDFLDTVKINPNHTQAQGNIGAIYHLKVSFYSKIIAMSCRRSHIWG